MSDFTKRIVYADGSNIVVLTPCPCGLTVEQIAAKDVPAGLPYLIVDATDIPADRQYRAAWTADFSAPDGYGIGPEAWAAEQARPKPQPTPQPEPQPNLAPDPLPHEVAE